MQKKNDEIQNKPVIQTKPIMTHRYVCHGCTKPAGYSAMPESVVSVTCPHCGMTQSCALENWIIMSDEEKAHVNA